MLSHFRYWRGLRKLRRERERVERIFDPIIREARDSEDLEKLNSALFEARFEADMVDEEISALVTITLVREAHRRMLPLPDRTDDRFWEEAPITQTRKVLSPAGVTHLRTLIREEKRAFREHAGFWIASLTGIIGALIGLASILKD